MTLGACCILFNEFNSLVSNLLGKLSHVVMTNTSDHNCHNCRRTGKLVVVGFSKYGVQTAAPESDWVYGEDGDYS